MRPSSSRRSARATTAGRRCSRSGRTRAGGASSSRGSTPGPTDTVLDVATGTGAVALELVRQKDCFVVGVDQSPEMLEDGRRRVGSRPRRARSGLQEGDARALPFDDGQFDALTFTYLLRYVDDPAATLRELARVVQPGGTIAGLEFGVPRGVWRPPWELWMRVGLPAAGAVIGHGWHEVGSFLGPSIRELLRALAAATAARGLARRRDRGRPGAPPEPRRRDRDVGTQEERKACVLRAAPAAAGATTSRCCTRRTRSGISRTSRSAPRSRRTSTSTGCCWALAAFFLAMGVAAHALDELNGRPLRTRIPVAALVALAVVVARRRARDRHRRGDRVGLRAARLRRDRRGSRPGLQPRAVRRRLHNELGFALAWGAFPALTGYFVEAQTLRLEAIAGRGLRDRAEPRAADALDAGAPTRAATHGDDGGHRAARARAAAADVGDGRARRRARRGAPTMRAVTAAAIVAVVAALRRRRALVGCDRRPAHACATSSARSSARSSAARASSTRSSRRSSSSAAPSSSGRSRARAPTRSRGSPRRSGGSPRSAAATSPSANATRPRRLGEQLVAAQRAVEQRLADWSIRRREAAGGPHRRARSGSRRRQRQLMAEIEARIGQDAERLQGQIEEQRQLIARLRDGARPRRPGGDAAGERRSSSSTRRNGAARCRSVADRMRKRERDLQELIEREGNEATQRIQLALGDVERRQVEQLQRIVTRETTRYAEAASQQFDTAIRTAREEAARRLGRELDLAVERFAREAEGVLTERAQPRQRRRREAGRGAARTTARRARAPARRGARIRSRIAPTRSRPALRERLQRDRRGCRGRAQSCSRRGCRIWPRRLDELCARTERGV